jgi:hypothetical protein
MGKNSKTGRKSQKCRIRNLKNFLWVLNPKKTTPRHSKIKPAKIKTQGKNLKHQNKSKSPQMQRNTHEAISGFLSRKFVPQEIRGDIFKLVKEKILPAKNNFPGKAVLCK